MEMKFTTLENVAAVASALVVANGIWNWATNYPFLYCELRGVGWSVYQSLGPPIAWMLCAGLAYYLMGLKAWKAMIFVTLILGLNNLPQLAENLLKMGGSCV